MIVALLLVAGGIGAGMFGSLLGLGGGILIVPLLTFGFGLSIREAAGVSLVAVIVTSSAAASVYLQRHTANLRLGMSLELFTAIGALTGGLIAFTLSDRVLAGLFALLLLYTALTMFRRRDPSPAPVAASAPVDLATPPASTGAGAGAAAEASTGAHVAATQALSGSVVTAGSSLGPGRLSGLSSADTLAGLSGPGYRVRNLGRGIVGAFFAGIVSAVLGIGGGIIKVPVMHLVMGVPLRIATATSNLMIGVTATASAVIYVLRGGMDPLVVGPIAVGVFLGASAGSRIAPRVHVRYLRLLFVVVMIYTALQMVLRAAGQ